MLIYIYVGISKSDVMATKARKTVILACSRDNFMAVFGLIRVAASTDGPDFFGIISANNLYANFDILYWVYQKVS